MYDNFLYSIEWFKFLRNTALTKSVIYIKLMDGKEFEIRFSEINLNDQKI